MNALSESDIETLWSRMAAIYGHRWVSSYGPADADDTWLMGLSGLTQADLARGLASCVCSGNEWPPSLPLFRRLCLGLPDKGFVLESVMRKDLSDPVSVEIARQIGSYNLRNWDDRRIEERIKRLYASVIQIVTDRAIAARRIPAPSPATPRLAAVQPA